MTPTERLGLIMLETGLRLDAFAKSISYSPSAVSLAINHDIGSKRLFNAIAGALNRSVLEIWPDKKSPSSGHNTGVVGGTVSTVPEGGHLLQEKAGA